MGLGVRSFQFSVWCFWCEVESFTYSSRASGALGVLVWEFGFGVWSFEIRILSSGFRVYYVGFRFRC